MHKATTILSAVIVFVLLQDVDAKEKHLFLSVPVTRLRSIMRQQNPAVSGESSWVPEEGVLSVFP